MNSKFTSLLPPWATSVLVSWFLAVPTRADSIIQFPVSSCTVNKGIGRLAVPVQRQNDLSTIASVRLSTVASTAVDGIDYAGTNATLTFQAGETQRVVHIPLFNDGTLDNSKTFKVLLSDPTAGATLGVRTNLIVKVANNNQGLHFYLPAVLINEDAGQVVIKVARGDSVDRRVSVDYATTNGTAKAGQEYRATAGTVTFDPGEVLKSFTVPILNDHLAGPPKTFMVALSNPIGGAVLAPPNGMPTVMTVTIDDTDQTVQLEFLNYSVREESPFVQVGITSGAHDSDISVDLVTIDKTAIAGRDYVGITNTIRFGPGERRKLIQIPILDNNFKTSSGSFGLKLLNPIGGATLGTNKLATVTITDNDPGFGFTSSRDKVWYITGVANISVNRGGGEAQSSFTVEFQTVDGTATAGVDYQSVTGTLRFEPNETIHNIAVPILPNQSTNTSKYFKVVLSNPSNGTVLEGSAASKVVDIIYHQKSWPVTPLMDAKLKLKHEGDMNAVTWTNKGFLLYADQVNGPWEKLNGTDSPYTARAALAAGFYRIQSTRPTTVYVPSSYDGRTPLPLILAVHYLSGSADGFRSEFPLESLAESKGFLVCYPQAISTVNGALTWNGPDFLKFPGVDTDDSGYLRSVIEEIRRQFVVDPKRIYAFGDSAGAMMCHRLAYDHADLIAGIASLAGATTYDPNDCHPTQPVNVLEVHGNKDDVAPYYGGYLNTGVPIVGEMPGSVRTVQIWAELNGSRDPIADAVPSIKTAGATPDTTVLRYNQCSPGGAVELWTVNNADHFIFFSLASSFLPQVVDWLLAHPKL